MNINDSVLKNDEIAIFKLRNLYRKYGYSQFRMSKFEEYDLYVRNKNFLTSDNIITFTDKGGKLLALKPDVTLSIVKNTKDVPGYVHKVYYNENVYRVAKGSDSYKEINQVGLECVGDLDEYCISEVLALAVESLKAISTDFVLDISHLGVLSSVLDDMDVPNNVRKQLIACVGEKSTHGVIEICKQAGVDADKADKLVKLIALYGDASKVIPQLRDLVDVESGKAAVSQLENIATVLSGIAPEGSIRIDFSVTNNISYYNGIVFKGFASGIPAAILSGGQYDLLMKKMGKKSGAIGFAVYPDLIEDHTAADEEYDVDAVILYGDEDELTAVYSAVRELTEKGLSVTAQKSIPKKLKYRQLIRVTESGVEILEENS